MRTPIKKVYHCPWCKEGSGLIFPEDLYKAIRMPGGSLKCEVCQTEELQDRIVRVTPNSQRAREIVAEEQREVSRYNDNAQRLNKSAGYELMKLKRNKYGSK
jgi:hypothetical protein